MIPTFWEDAAMMVLCLLIACIPAYFAHRERRAMWDPIFDALCGPSPAMKALIDSTLREAERRHHTAIAAALEPPQISA